MTCPTEFQSRLRTAVKTCLKESSEGDCSTGKYGPIAEWDVSRVRDMKDLFANAKSFNGDISKWNVAKVTTMHGMFGRAYSFNTDISNWNVAKVTSMWRMFYSARLFNIDISKWDVSKVNKMNGMFIGAKSFSHTLCGEAWVKSTADKTDMFKD